MDFESREFTVDPEGINPGIYPYKTLYNGARMPALGMGTFGSDHVSYEDIAESVFHAMELGYRHFDCASVYGNEDLIGRAFARALASGKVRREELFVTGKVWNDKHAPEDVIASCEKSLKDLQLEYLDLYLIHWPFPNYHPPGCDVSSRSPDAKPYIHENYMKTWRAMEELYDRGLVKNIGVSNMTIPKMDLLLRDCRIKPAVIEMELHPHFQQQEFFDYILSKGIQPVGYSPLGSPNRPERDRTAADTVDTQDPVILACAERLGIHPATVCLKWAFQRGQIPIPFSVNRRNYLSNLKCVLEEALSDEEMAAIAKIDKNCRLIKGDVFLWKDDQTWEALWDVDGVITPA
ncbi:MAG: aldo/keto reductase [Spirochaetales bacterium]|nr:aldo/keto reductase [Spirochaetales bacterium]